MQHHYFVVVQDLATQWIQSFPYRANVRSRIFGRSAKVPKSIHTDNSLEFIKHVSNSIGIIEGLLHIDLRRMELQSEPYEGSKKVRWLCSFSWVCMNIGGQHMTCYCHLRNIEDSQAEARLLVNNCSTDVHRTPCRTHFLMRTVCQVLLSGSHPSLIFHALAWLKMKLCAFSKRVHTSRNLSYITPELTSTFAPCTRTPSYPSAATIHNKRVSALWLMYAP